MAKISTSRLHVESNKYYCTCDDCRETGNAILLFVKILDSKSGNVYEYMTAEGIDHMEDIKKHERVHEDQPCKNTNKRPKGSGDWKYHRGRAIARAKNRNRDSISDN